MFEAQGDLRTGVKYLPVAANKNIAQGDAVVWASGYVQSVTVAGNNGDATELNFVGVAVNAANNTGGAAGAISVYVQLYSKDNTYKVATTGAPSQAMMGTICDFETAGTVDEADVTLAAANTIGFHMDEFDATGNCVWGRFSSKGV